MTITSAVTMASSAGVRQTTLVNLTARLAADLITQQVASTQQLAAVTAIPLADIIAPPAAANIMTPVAHIAVSAAAKATPPAAIML